MQISRICIKKTVRSTNIPLEGKESSAAGTQTKGCVYEAQEKSFANSQIRTLSHCHIVTSAHWPSQHDSSPRGERVKCRRHADEGVCLRSTRKIIRKFANSHIVTLSHCHICTLALAARLSPAKGMSQVPQAHRRKGPSTRH